MANQILKRREPRKPARPPGPPGPQVGTALVTEKEEALVADPRGRLTPAQMVEQKLLVLLRTGSPGLYAQAAGGRYDVRRTGRP